MARAKVANICINILSELSHIELLQYDAARGAFLRLDSEDFMFDPATREMLEDTDRFKTLLKRLFERNRIPLKSPTTVVIPSFFTREYEVTSDFLGEDLKTILISEAERFYVFKKLDPEIGYMSMKGNKFLYTAYPKQAIESIKTAFSALKIPLVSIDCNCTATLRGLLAMGLVQQEMENDTKWGLMIISDYSIFMAVVEGIQFEKTLEAPLPLQNTEEEALLNEIRDDFQQFFGYEILARMVIVNSSLKLYSTSLIENLGFQGQTDVFVQNDRTLSSRKAVDAPFPCTLEAVGGALVSVVTDVPALELMDQEEINSYSNDQLKSKISIILLVAGLVIFLGQYGVGILIDSLTAATTRQGTQLSSDIETFLSSLKLIPEVKQQLYIKQGVAENIKVSNFIVKSDQSLPPDAWLKKLSIKVPPDFKTLNVSISGSALTPDPINTYLKELNLVVGTSALTPSVAPVEQDNHRFFDYTLTNIAKDLSKKGAPGK